jgi:hypothetical protein
METVIPVDALHVQTVLWLQCRGMHTANANDVGYIPVNIMGANLVRIVSGKE